MSNNLLQNTQNNYYLPNCQQQDNEKLQTVFDGSNIVTDRSTNNNESCYLLSSPIQRSQQQQQNHKFIPQDEYQNEKEFDNYEQQLEKEQSEITQIQTAKLQPKIFENQEQSKNYKSSIKEVIEEEQNQSKNYEDQTTAKPQSNTKIEQCSQYEKNKEIFTKKKINNILSKSCRNIFKQDFQDFTNKDYQKQKTKEEYHNQSKLQKINSMQQVLQQQSINLQNQENKEEICLEKNQQLENNSLSKFHIFDEQVDSENEIEKDFNKQDSILEIKRYRDQISYFNYQWLLYPDDKFKMYFSLIKILIFLHISVWDYIILISLFYTLFILPYRISFITEPLLTHIILDQVQFYVITIIIKNSQLMPYLLQILQLILIQHFLIVMINQLCRGDQQQLIIQKDGLQQISLLPFLLTCFFPQQNIIIQ